MVDIIFDKKLQFRIFPKELAINIIECMLSYNGWGNDDTKGRYRYLLGVDNLITNEFRRFSDKYEEWDINKLKLFVNILDYIESPNWHNDISWCYPRIDLLIVYDGIEFSERLDMGKDFDEEGYHGIELERIKNYLL